MKCIECDCTPYECQTGNSSFDCPNCSLKECYCWLTVHSLKSV